MQENRTDITDAQVASVTMTLAGCVVEVCPEGSTSEATHNFGPPVPREQVENKVLKESKE